ncbi:MAG TPA: acyl-CoA dehydrogenase family protein, partial [Kineosporiaceae bacterium]
DIPAEFGGQQLQLGSHRFGRLTALERALVLEELACGDAGMLLASPGASLSGQLILQIADRDQQQRYYERLLSAPTWTFFALSEPEHGSNATGITTTVQKQPDSLVVNGQKRWIGNAAHADLGVVFGRTGPGPLAMVAVLVETATPGFRAEPIDTLGLRAARLSHVVLDDVHLDPDALLGRHLPAGRRGISACREVFHRFRGAVAAVAVGIARAAHEYVADRHPSSTQARDRLAELGARIRSTRALVHRAAMASDAGERGQLPSAAKLSACRLAEQVTIEAAQLLGPAARLEHPLLDKLARDARGVEFMEGAGNIQRLTLFPTLLADHRPPATG